MLARIARYALVTLVLAAAIDLSLAALFDYRLRSDVALLLGVELLGLAALCLSALSASAVAGRVLSGSWFFSAPRACVLISALVPALLRLAIRESFLVLAGLLVVLLILLAIEARVRPGPPRPVTLLAPGAAASFAILAFLFTGIPGRSQFETAAGAQAEPRDATNLVLIVLDTLRADHLGVYGYERTTSPYLDRFAEEAFVFERAYSSSSWTVPAHATLFTGLHTRAHGADIVREDEPGVSPAELGRGYEAHPIRPLSSEAITLAEVLREQGYETGAVSANTYLHRAFGFAQGFDSYVDAAAIRFDWVPAGISFLRRVLFRGSDTLRNAIASNERPYLSAREVSQLGREWLDSRHGRPFFLFLNYMDAHSPRAPEAAYRDDFQFSNRPEHISSDEWHARAEELPEFEHRALVDRYDAEIRYLDAQLASLLEALRGSGALERTLVVITSDHGEAFGEHQSFFHRNTVYEPQVRIPMIVRLPGQQRGERVGRFVHLADVMPTVLRRLEIASPEDLQGVDLFADDRKRSVVAEISPDRYYAQFARYNRDQVAFYQDPWKLIARSDGDHDLFDLRRDPDELQDLSAERPEVVDSLQANLARFKREVRPRFDVAGSQADRDLTERLRALGYLDAN